ncbi:MAG TPA: hypothetical protein VEZ12_20320 [Herpetosiphonaceae bacterium]|nr:hypothetical protein [Herpetosiphonaceae bacterium]
MPSPSLSPIRVASSGRYFETFDGEPFLFIGPNDAITWQGLAGLYRHRDLPAVEAYLADLTAHGVTILRLMLEYVQHEGRYFERPAGRFNPAMVRLWDDLFACCERVGLRVLLAPWDNFWTAYRWRRHPYNVVNGGPAQGPGSFLSDEATIAATERRLRYVVERWGGSGVLAAWDLFNEIDPYWGGTPASQFEVVTRLSDTVREAEQRTWGFTRPQTVSIFGPSPPPEYEPLIFKHPKLDFATTHIYSSGTIDHPTDTVAPAVALAGWVRHALARIAPGRPYTDTEHGPIHLFNDHKRMMPETFDDEYERHLMWAHLATGGAGSGMRWPARRPHVLTPGTRRSLRSLAGFTRLIDWRAFMPQDAAGEVMVATEGLLVFACRDPRQAVIWLLRCMPEKAPRGVLPIRPPLRDVAIEVPGFDGGAFVVNCWDTHAGQSLGTQAVRVGPDSVLRLVLPEVGNDLALAVRAEVDRP